MGTGIALLIAFVLGAAAMFLVSEHYYKRIERFFRLSERPQTSRTPPPQRAIPTPPRRDTPFPVFDETQGEAFERGERVTTRVERRP